MPQSWRLAGWAAFGLLMLFLALAWPARADVNPWSREVAASGPVAALHPATLLLDRRGRIRRLALARSGLSGVVAPLAAKAREIVDACGARVASAVRRTHVAGTRRLSLHASGRAVDLVGAPACIYRHLAGWPGGYSTDYGRVRHVHVSWGGAEHGRRFAHRARSARTVWRES